MARKLKYDIPGPDWRVEVEEAREKGWPALFDAPALPLVVEIGFGRGEFLTYLAGEAPNQAFVGIEYSEKRVLKLARRLARSELRNVRLLGVSAQEATARTIPDASVSCFWINFPDPWPKKRHFKRRLIAPAFARELVRCLRPGGILEVATDHRGYAGWIDEVLNGTPGLENLNAPQPWRASPEAGRMATAYELEWRALGHPFHFFRHRRRP
ncbi:MAG: tRNA (guanosine(46)-N7)-methyltransferase TrmB [Myxococcales bacterium]|nr:tRNA (guanosine(46)-N7)-methyltransferase TrmB [Myxococcales bacterium]